uniref:Uncharacterized protein n=1 Tax=Panagrellus redivivus TaxID=6233 RepID=A0A7E4VIY6_PANRE
MLFRIFAVGCTLAVVMGQQRRLPTAAEIEDYDDPVLREIFKKTTPPPYNPNPEQAYGPTTVPNGYSPYTNYNTQQPNQLGYGQQNFVSPYAPQHPYYQTQMPAVPAQFTNLAAQGAQTFYSGAQQVGHAFGIQPNQYEVPLISSAASIFG